MRKIFLCLAWLWGNKNYHAEAARFHLSNSAEHEQKRARKLFFFAHNCNFPQLCIATQIPCGFDYKSGKTFSKLFLPTLVIFRWRNPSGSALSAEQPPLPESTSWTKFEQQHQPLTKCPLKRTRSICAANLNRKEDRGATEKWRWKRLKANEDVAFGPRLLNPRWELQHLEKTVLVITVHRGKVREPQCTSGYVNSCQECWWVLHRFQNCLPSSTQQRSDNSGHINVRPRAKCNLRLTAEVKLLRASRKHPQ